MQLKQTFGAATFVLSLLMPAWAYAALVISANPTEHVTCASGICKATAKDAVLNINDVTNMLASADLRIQTGSVARNIVFAAPLNWATSNTLILDARRSIDIKREITDAGQGGLSLITNDGGTAGTLSFDGGSVVFWGTSNALTINGISFNLVNNIAALASGIAAKPSGNFALSRSYDASIDGTYTAAPIPTTFTGNFQGLGNTISHLTISNTSVTKQRVDLGLFALLQQTGSIQNVRMTRVKVTGGSQYWISGLVTVSAGYLFGNFVEGHFSGGYSAGALATSNHGKIVSCRAAGVIGTPGGNNGGLVNYNYGQITNSSASTSLENGGGGLVGFNYGTISNSHASGAVSGEGNSSGGLVAYMANYNGAPVAITNSYATGAVTGSRASYAGGLVGYADNSGPISITNSHATGDVTASQAAGGLVGEIEGYPTAGEIKIVDSFATGNVDATADAANYVGYAGGLVGELSGVTVSRSFATGAVTAAIAAGGLFGERVNGVVADTYATGAVTSGTGETGGLGGDSEDTTDRLATSYATGTVTEGGCQGGFLGRNGAAAGSMMSDHWNTTTSGTSGGVGCGDGSGIRPDNRTAAIGTSVWL